MTRFAYYQTNKLNLLKQNIKMIHFNWLSRWLNDSLSHSWSKDDLYTMVAQDDKSFNGAH